MSEIYTKLLLEAPAHNRSAGWGNEDIINGATKEVGFGVFLKGKKLGKNEKEEDKMVAYITQQEIVRAFVEIVKMSSIFEMLGNHKGTSFDHMILTALKEIDAAVELKSTEADTVI